MIRSPAVVLLSLLLSATTLFAAAPQPPMNRADARAAARVLLTQAEDAYRQRDPSAQDRLLARYRELVQMLKDDAASASLLERIEKLVHALSEEGRQERPDASADMDLHAVLAAAVDTGQADRLFDRGTSRDSIPVPADGNGLTTPRVRMERIVGPNGAQAYALPAGALTGFDAASRRQAFETLAKQLLEALHRSADITSINAVSEDIRRAAATAPSAADRDSIAVVVDDQGRFWLRYRMNGKSIFQATSFSLGGKSPSMNGVNVKPRSSPPPKSRVAAKSIETKAGPSKKTGAKGSKASNPTAKTGGAQGAKGGGQPSKSVVGGKPAKESKKSSLNGAEPTGIKKTGAAPAAPSTEKQKAPAGPKPLPDITPVPIKPKEKKSPPAKELPLPLAAEKSSPPKSQKSQRDKGESPLSPPQKNHLGVSAAGSSESGPFLGFEGKKMKAAPERKRSMDSNPKTAKAVLRGKSKPYPRRTKRKKKTLKSSKRVRARKKSIRTLRKSSGKTSPTRLFPSNAPSPFSAPPGRERALGAMRGLAPSAH